MSETGNSLEPLSFSAELRELFEEKSYDLGLRFLDRSAESVRYLLELKQPKQYPRMFKVPNLIHDELEIEAAEIVDISGSYTDWLLTVPWSY